ncbi:putative membrane protein (TIGR02234 family) [Nocardioides salarius]|uniref:Membrane protein (TIGR02234 family) n=1 Tax=Nocardioides salarius TaxID=374513 RepID=A0ABS2MFX9_9ACTN|nr:Trp biosynthesis-associated membrane protein [Nocardioides salarius]MBM7510109.1 putative membrane protein (TIGR02234 family) [Nocardioides salarius]
MAEPHRARRTFAPVVLLGLAAGTLTAVAGTRPGVDVVGDPGSGVTASVGLGGPEAAYDLPLVTSLALVALAAWGVVLVTRGRVRRVVVAVGLLGSVGALVAALAAWGSLPDELRTALEQVGAGDTAVTRTGWYAAAVVGSLLLVLASGAALRLVPHWPEMGSRYDAPTGQAAGARPAAPTRPVEELSGLDLWRAIDEGHDPTDDDTSGPDRGAG